MKRDQETHLVNSTKRCHSHLWETGIFMFVPELRSGGVSENLGSWLNMLASGLICAFSGGAGGGTPGSTLFWGEEEYDEHLALYAKHEAVIMKL